MTLPGASVSVLPLPAKEIAVPPAPLIVPALKTDVLPLDPMARESEVIRPPALLVTLPLSMEIAFKEPPPDRAETVPEFVTLTTLPWMAIPPRPVAEMVPKFVMVRWGVCEPETPKASPVTRPVL